MILLVILDSIFGIQKYKNVLKKKALLFLNQNYFDIC